MNYSFYLFTQLRTLIAGQGVVYDIQFGIDQNLFATYETSEYNIPNEPEYECMVNFLKAYKNGEFRTTIDSEGNVLSKKDWVVLLEPRSIEHPILTPKKGDLLRFIRTNDEDDALGEFIHMATNESIIIFADRTLKLNK